MRTPIAVVLGAVALVASGCHSRQAPAAAGAATSARPAPAAGAAQSTGSDARRSTTGAAAQDSTGLATNLTLTAAQVRHGGVRWAPVAMGTDARRALVPGEVIANEDRTARLGAPAGGRVLAVRVQPGDRVARGRVLVVLQSPAAGAAQSDVSKATAVVISAKAQVAYTDAARARAQRLLALEAIPRQDYDRAIADDKEAHASLAQAQSELTRATTIAAQLGAADAARPGEIVIRSPMRGVVLERSAVPGTVVSAGAPLVVITDPATLWLSISAPEQFSGLFRFGQRVRFTVPAYPADTFSARIDAVGAGLDSATRTLTVRGKVRNPHGRLKPEMLASVLVEGGDRVPAALVPQDAVQLLDGKPTIFIAHPDGSGGVHVERRAVDLGSRTGGREAVVRGLSAGDVIVVGGAFAVKAEFRKATMPKES